jgi:hypothetical protein
MIFCRLPPIREYDDQYQVVNIRQVQYIIAQQTAKDRKKKKMEVIRAMHEQ